MDELTSFQQAYTRIMKILKRYIIMEEKYYPITALWIMGTYHHKEFGTYPYIFLNASKGSGKSRLLKLIAYLSKNGNLIGLPSEAFMFRAAETNTFCLDEMENVGRKEKEDLRLLLNSAYKKGLKVPRMKKDKEGNLVAEMHETFAPICIANIWGLDDVLQDRCITIMLEKANDPAVTKLTEMWDRDPYVQAIKTYLEKASLTLEYAQAFFATGQESVCSECMLGVFECIEKLWNDILINIGYTLHTYYIPNTTYTSYTKEKLNELFDQAFSSLDWTGGAYGFEPTKELMQFFKKIYLSDLDGRNLELFFPLIMMSSFVSDELVEEIIRTANSEVGQRRSDELLENRDVLVLQSLSIFIQGKNPANFYSLNDLKAVLNEIVGEERERKDGSIMKVSPDWLTLRWIGGSIKRAKVTLEKKRDAHGFKFRFDFGKIQEKAKILGIENLELEPPQSINPEKDRPDLSDYTEAAEKMQEENF